MGDSSTVKSMKYFILGYTSVGTKMVTYVNIVNFLTLVIKLIQYASVDSSFNCPC
jgi:hypothetical protein